MQGKCFEYMSVKAGDVLVCVDDDRDPYWTVGKEYKVTSRKEIIDDDGDEWYVSYAKFVHKAEWDAAKKFKVGDKVRVIADGETDTLGPHEQEIGSIHTVSEVDLDGDIRVDACFFAPSHIELVTDGATRYTDWKLWDGHLLPDTAQTVSDKDGNIVAFREVIQPQVKVDDGLWVDINGDVLYDNISDGRNQIKVTSTWVGAELIDVKAEIAKPER